MTVFRTRASLAAATAMALALSACDDRRSARVDAPEPTSLAAFADLPVAAPSPVQRYEPARGYQWAERAYGLQRAFYDTPPDYGFEYGGREPLGWDTADDWSLYAEPVDDGYRYYYYEPGQAHPYFVRDRDYGYGYDRLGTLVAVFDSSGRYLDQDVTYRVAPLAGRYYARGEDLRRAARARRVSVSEQVWVQQAPRVQHSADPWLRAARQDRGWTAWRERDRDQELGRFENEQRSRQDIAQRGRERRDAVTPATLPPLPPLPDRDDRGEGRRVAQMQAQAVEAQARQGRLEAERRRDADALQRQAGQAQRQAEQQQHQQQQQARRDGQRQGEAAQARQQQRQQAQQAQQAEAGRRQQAEAARQQAQGQQRAQAEHARQAQQHAQQAEAGRRSRPDAAGQPARAADQQGRAAAAREHGGGRPDNGQGGKGKGPDKPHGHDKKD